MTGMDRAEFVETIPLRQCCDSQINGFHEDDCVNAPLNDKWKDLGAIVDFTGHEGGVMVSTLSGEPVPVRLTGAKQWGVSIKPTVPYHLATESGPPPGIAPRSLPEEPSGVYRDLAEVLTAENATITAAAYQVLDDLSVKLDGPYFETYRLVAEFFIANLILLHERNEMAHDAWRATGWAGNLMTLWGKAKRLMNNLWWFPDSDVRKEKALDHFGDTAIYSAFCAVLWQANDERGAER